MLGDCSHECGFERERSLFRGDVTVGLGSHVLLFLKFTEGSLTEGKLAISGGATETGEPANNNSMRMQSTITVWTVVL